MRFSRRIGAVLWLAGVLGAVQSPAIASEDDAKTLFARGRELRAAGQCEDAITAFRRALEIYPGGLGALRNIAECEEKLGMYASARRDWWDLRRAVLLTNEPKYDGWNKDAEKSHGALDRKVPKLVVKLSGEALDRVRIVLDGKPLDPRLLGVEIERDLGVHIIEAFFDNVAPLTKKATLTEGSREVVTLTIPKRSGDGPRIEASSAKTADHPALRTAGFVSIGVGGLGVVAAAISLGLRAGALSAIEAGCPGYASSRCPANLKGQYDTGVTTSMLVNVFGGVAVVGMGVGAALLVMSSGSSAPPASAAKAATRRTAAALADIGIEPLAGGAQARATVRFP